METAHGNPALMPPVIKEFTHGGQTYIYDYSRLVKQQCDMGSAVYRFQIDRQKKLPAGSMQEYMMTQSANYDVWVLSFILMKKISDTEIEAFPVSPNIAEWENSHQFQFAAKMPTSYEGEVEEIITDFFGKPSRYMLGSQIRTTLISGFLETAIAQFQELTTKKNGLSSLVDSINKVNSSAESLKPEPVEVTGLSQAETLSA